MKSKKLLVTLITTVILTICFGATAYASEIDNTANLSTSGTAEGIDNTVVSSDTTSQVPDANAETLEAGEVAMEDNLDLLLQEGYYLDEQGQVCYEEPTAELEEIVAEEVNEDQEDVKAEEEKEVVVKKASYSEKDLRLLACLVYSEAGNQNYNSMLGVANVVLNRMKSDVYWHVNTVEEVIYDHKWSVQFAVTIKNKKSGSSMLDRALKYYDTGKFTGSNPEAEKKAMNKAIKAAKAALEGTNNIGDYLCFQNKRAASSIKRKFSDYKILDDHIFYRTK